MAKRTWNAAASGSWATAANWLELAVPAAGDDVLLANNASDVSGGYAQGAVALATLSMPMTYTGLVGLATQPMRSVSGIAHVATAATATSTAHGYSVGDVVTISGADQAAYNGTFVITDVADPDTFAYTMGSDPGADATGAAILVTKASYLRVGATNWRIGDPSGSSAAASGSKRIKIDFGATQFTGVVVGTANASADAGLEPVRILGSHAANKLVVSGGRVGVATTLAGETATLAELDVVGNAAAVNCGAGVTLTALRQSAGTTTLSCGFTNGYLDGGALTVNGSGAITTLDVTGGTANLNSTGTITTLEVRNGGTANLTGDYRARTVTTVKLYRGATLKYDPGVVTITDPIQLVGCTTEDVTILTPSGVTLAIVKA